jgi:hypothetical protein
VWAVEAGAGAGAGVSADGAVVGCSGVDWSDCPAAGCGGTDWGWEQATLAAAKISSAAIIRFFMHTSLGWHDTPGGSPGQRVLSSLPREDLVPFHGKRILEHVIPVQVEDYRVSAVNL